MFKMTFLVLHRQRRYRTCYLQCDVILEAVKTNTYINTFCSIPMFTFSTYKLKHLSVNHFLAERKTDSGLHKNKCAISTRVIWKPFFFF